MPFGGLQVMAPDVFKPHMFYEGWHEDLFKNRDHYRWLEADVRELVALARELRA